MGVLFLAGLARAWDLACTPWGRRLALAVGALLVVLFARGHWLAAGLAQGVAQEQAAEAKREAAARKAVLARQSKASAIAAQAAAGLADAQRRNAARTEILIRKVPVYVPLAADAGCIVPVGFVRLLDAAAPSRDPTGVPAAAGGPVDAPSGVALSAVAETVIANYAVAYDWRAEALTWRDWYARQAAAWAAPNPPP